MAETILPDCVEALRRYARQCQSRPRKSPEAWHSSAAPTYPANQIVGMGLYGEVTVTTWIAWSSSSTAAACLRPSCIAAGRCRCLLAGRTRLSHCRIQFGADPADIRSEEPFAARGYRHRTSHAADRGPWMQAIAKGFSQEIPVAEEVFGGFAALPGALAFLARIEGEVVGGCGGRIIPEARIAALFGTATLPEFRGRGVQSALIALRLHEAAKAGCEYAVVSTNPGSGSQRNMERRGFRVAYTKVVMMREWPEMPAAGTM